MDFPRPFGSGRGDDEDDAPGQMIRDPGAEAISRERDEERKRVLSATAHTPRPALAPIGGVLLILVGASLLAAQWTLYPIGQTGQDNALRDLGLGIVAALAGLRVVVGQPGRHPVAAAAAFLSALGLLLAALLASHAATHITVTETVAGLVALLGALLCAFSPTSAERPSKTRRQET